MKIKKVSDMGLIKESSNTLELAKEYDWEEEYEYFNYIADSLTNGQHKQVMDLFNALNSDGKKEFLDYVKNNSNFTDVSEYIKDRIVDMWLDFA